MGNDTFQDEYNCEDKIEEINGLSRRKKGTARDAEIQRLNKLLDEHEEKQTEKSVVLMYAMHRDAQPIIDQYCNPEEDTRWEVFNKETMPCKVFTGKTGSVNLTVIVNGEDSKLKVDNTALTPAAMTATLVCMVLKPDVVINVGSAGGWQHGEKKSTLNDIYIPTSVQYHDRRIVLPGNWINYGIGTLEMSYGQNVCRALGFNTGLCTTGNSLTTSPTEKTFFDGIVRTGLQSITQSPNGHPDVKDMEFAAIAWVCAKFDMKCFGMKGICNFEDDPLKLDAFLANGDTLKEALKVAVMKVVDHINKNRVSNL